MNNRELVKLLHEYADAKKKVKEIRVELVKVVVQDIGMEQKEAHAMDIETFLNGYLIGQDVKESWRKK